ncbi:MAG TPA: energy transducer TonB [Dyella sp.]|uniref:energy transducer TonB n=1 Tax=Dyella sp. TaxID=1869338 RepID=UPI002D78ABD7|nr:energy transducer TonB [Dyella sp.]HET6554656.1 energy transducer TonB [Dyella sp.]
MPPVSSSRTQGVARSGFLIVLIFVLAGAGAIFWWLKKGADADDPAPTVVAAAGPVIREGAGIDEVLQHARRAMAENRLLAPAGNNAFELYLVVLRREPSNRVAQDALREIFPFAAHAAEQAIDEGNDAESQRQIDLLTQADPQNYTLTLLQSKLQARRDAAAQHALPAAAPAKREVPATEVVTAPRTAAAAPVPATPAPAPPPVTNAVATPAAKPANALTPAEEALARLDVESTPIKAAPRATPKKPQAAPVVANANGATAPVLTRRVEPVYPTEARRTRRQGWVDVTFTVQSDGSVTGASVTDADPKYVFDRAALGAVARWQFTPGTQDGTPVAAQMRQRIEFRL